MMKSAVWIHLYWGPAAFILLLLPQSQGLPAFFILLITVYTKVLFALPTLDRCSVLQDYQPSTSYTYTEPK